MCFLHVQMINGLHSEYGVKSIGVIGMWCARSRSRCARLFRGPVRVVSDSQPQAGTDGTVAAHRARGASALASCGARQIVSSLLNIQCLSCRWVLAAQLGREIRAHAGSRRQGAEGVRLLAPHTSAHLGACVGVTACVPCGSACRMSSAKKLPAHVSGGTGAEKSGCTGRPNMPFAHIR